MPIFSSPRHVKKILCQSCTKKATKCRIIPPPRIGPSCPLPECVPRPRTPLARKRKDMLGAYSFRLARGIRGGQVVRLHRPIYHVAFQQALPEASPVTTSARRPHRDVRLQCKPTESLRGQRGCHQRGLRSETIRRSKMIAMRHKRGE